jgi:hypothetical protein
MNDAELDRLVAATAPITEARVAALDLRDAEVELMEKVMATSASEKTLSSESPIAAPRRRHRWRRLAGAAVAALAAATIAVVTVHAVTDDRRNDVAIGGEVEVGLPRLIADPPPDGYPVATLEAEGAQTAWESTLDAESGYTVLYGDVAAPDPSNDLVLTVAAGAQTDMLYGHGEGLQPVTVRGHRGQACAHGRCGVIPGGSTVSWDERSGLTIILQSRSFGVESLVAIADGLEVDGHQAELGRLPPGTTGLDEVGRTQHWPTAGDDPTGHRVIYGIEQPAAGTARVRHEVSATVTPGDAAALTLRAWQTGNGHRVTVRGHDGWILMGSPPQEDPPRQGIRLSLIWMEAPGVLVDATIQTMALEIDFDLAGFAESLRPATDAEWAHGNVPASDAPAIEVGTDITDTEVTSYVPDDAQAYATTDLLGGAAYLAADGQICGFMVDQQGKLPDTCGPADQRIHELRDRGGTVRFLFGTMPAGTVAVQARRSGVEEPAPAFHDVFPEQSPRIWIFSTDIFVPEAVTFVDDDNNPVETVPYTP